VPGSDDRAPALRASDADRERAVTTLRAGAEEGRLTFDELAQRTELAYDATTAGELELLVADLPAPAPGSAPARATRARKRQRWNVAIMGGCDRRGRWRPAPRSVAVALMGGVKLDLRDASIDPGELRITAFALMGGVEVIVPDGIDVELTGFAIMGANDHRPGDAPIRPGTPLVHVRAFSLMGATEVKVRRPRSAPELGG
jgi:hypothetical protein